MTIILSTISWGTVLKIRALGRLRTTVLMKDNFLMIKRAVRSLMWAYILIILLITSIFRVANSVMSFPCSVKTRGFMLILDLKVAIVSFCIFSNSFSKDLIDVAFLLLIRLIFLLEITMSPFWIEKTCSLVWVKAWVQGSASRTWT